MTKPLQVDDGRRFVPDKPLKLNISLRIAKKTDSQHWRSSGFARRHSGGGPGGAAHL
jgi:hypothetical protein